MLTAAVLVPSPPILVPELNGADRRETGQLRTAAISAVSGLGARADHWIVLGTGPRDEIVGSRAAGTFQGFGVDIAVTLAPDVDTEPDPGLALVALVAGWLRGVAAPSATLECRIVATDTDPARCAALGAALRTELAAAPGPTGLLVVADGATTLTPKAPGAFDSRAPEFQAALDTALTRGDCAAIARIDPDLSADLGCSGRAAWQVLAAVFDPGPNRVTTDYADAPYGVGYHVGTWLP